MLSIRWGKKNFICGIILFSLVLDFLPAISLPYIQSIYIVKTSFNNAKQGIAIGTIQKVTKIHLGIWGACYYSESHSDCLKGYGYSVILTQNKSRITVVENGWTRPLVMPLVAVGVTLVALLLARFLPHRKTRLIGVGLAGSVSGIAIITEVALYVNVHGEMEKLGVGAVTKLGSGFYLILIPTILLSFLSLGIFIMDKYCRKDPVDDDGSSTAKPDESDEPDDTDEPKANIYKLNNNSPTSNRQYNSRNASPDSPTQQESPTHTQQLQPQPIEPGQLGGYLTPQTQNPAQSHLEVYPTPQAQPPAQTPSQVPTFLAQMPSQAPMPSQALVPSQALMPSQALIQGIYPPQTLNQGYIQTEQGVYGQPQTLNQYYSQLPPNQSGLSGQVHAPLNFQAPTQQWSSVQMHPSPNIPALPQQGFVGQVQTPPNIQAQTQQGFSRQVQTSPNIQAQNQAQRPSNPQEQPPPYQQTS